MIDYFSRINDRLPEAASRRCLGESWKMNMALHLNANGLWNLVILTKDTRVLGCVDSLQEGRLPALARPITRIRKCVYMLLGVHTVESHLTLWTTSNMYSLRILVIDRANAGKATLLRWVYTTEDPCICAGFVIELIDLSELLYPL